VDIYVVVYLISNALTAFALERFMKVFFEKKRVQTWIAVIPFLVYFIASSSIFLLLGIPIISLFVNILTIFVISLIYESTLVRRLSATACIVLFTVITDMIAVLLTDNSHVNHFVPFEYRDVFGFISWGLSVYLMALLLQRFKNVRRGVIVQPFHWIITIYIPTSSIFIISLLIASSEIPQVFSVFAIAMILVINVLAFYLCDALSAAYENQLQSKLYAQEKEHYLTQCQMMQDSVDMMKSFRHDVKLHFGTLKGMAAENEIELISKYLSTLSDYVKSSEVYSETGNLALDSIINYKLRDANERNIKLTINLISIPKIIDIEIIDMTTILGNLLDNALDALEKLDEKWIKLSARYKKGTLIIEVTNPFDGNIKFKSIKKEDKMHIASSKFGNNHGYGLKNIRKALIKYNGDMEVTHDNNVFSVKLLLILA